VTAARQQVQETASGIIPVVPEMDGQQFDQWVKLLEQRTGMVLPRERKSFLVTSLGLRMREIGCASYQEYFEKLNSGASSLVEWSTLVDRLTVHETRFFRHPASTDLVHEKVLSLQPDLDTGVVSVQAWSAGCSTGEEAYTLAMVIDQALQARRGAAYMGITATDISQPALMVGRKGIYPGRRVKGIDPKLLQEYFEPLDRDRYQVCERLRKRICFARMNIVDSKQGPLGQMDIIYCQNLLIYFDRERRETIVNNMAEHLRPGGLLILGAGEFVGWKHPSMEKISCSRTLAYQRRVDAE
jgi:type IV pilus assembly protein PilK